MTIDHSSSECPGVSNPAAHLTRGCSTDGTPRVDSRERVVLVDAWDRAIGSAPKLNVHRDGRLHRAVSVVITDGSGRLLMQRRADSKYHSPQLWSNTACGHPRPGEPASAAAARRLREEMGLVCPLDRLTVFQYRADVGGGLVEHEIDHLFVGQCTDSPVPDQEEVGAWRWMDALTIENELAHTPRRWTRWAPLILARYFRATRPPQTPRASRSLRPTAT